MSGQFSPEAAYRRARALHRDGKLDAAVALYRRVLAVRPAPEGAQGGLGAALCELGQAEEGIPFLRAAAAAAPDSTGAQFRLAAGMQQAGRDEEALAGYRRVAALDPHDTAARLCVAKTLLRLRRHVEAEHSFRRLAMDFPRHGEVLSGLALAIHHQGRHAEALPWHEKAAAVLGDNAEAHANLGMALLLLGRLGEGWPHLRWRMRSEVLRPKIGPRNVPKPEWDGRGLAGRTLLVHCEQGFGDNIQFLRYAAMVPRGPGGGRVIVACQQELAGLFGAAPGVDAVMHAARGGADQRVNLDRLDYDCQIAMLDLPAAFGTECATIPATVPYLAADRGRAAEWRRRLAPLLAQDAFRLGIVHAGSPTHDNDRNRSLPLTAFRSLWELPGVTVCLLHKDSQDAGGAPVAVLGPELRDFSDTAAVLDSLDLLVTADTAAAHLAGALGRPVWTLIPFVPDWRWMTGRDDTPWYPTMRLFRQTAPGEWEGVLARVAAALAAVLAGERARLLPLRGEGPAGS